MKTFVTILTFIISYVILTGFGELGGVKVMVSLGISVLLALACRDYLERGEIEDLKEELRGCYERLRDVHNDNYPDETQG